MIKRNIPFGYAMVNGEIVVCETEAATVRQIFSLYLQGASLSAIACAMAVPYNGGTSWDKHKVKRVLDNPRYCGSSGHPVLIDEADYIAAKQLKAVKNTSAPLPWPEDIQALKAAAFCQNCGGRFIRTVNHGYVRWACSNSGCENNIGLRDAGLKNAVTKALNDIIANPGVLHIAPLLNPMPMAVTKLQNEVNREMSKTQPDAEQTRALLFALAAEKYKHSRDAQAAVAFRALFEDVESVDQFDLGLFTASVDKVLINETGAVALRLKNGQTLPG